MNDSDAKVVLERLLGLLCRSLPAYLADARPWAKSANPALVSELERLAADQDRYARRVADAIVAGGGRPEPGRFPIEYTSKHDLNLAFLVQEVIDGLHRDADTVKHCAAQLEDLPPLHSLAEEIHGNLRGHLDLLREMSKSPTASTP
jgi:hypothetical protein